MNYSKEEIEAARKVLESKWDNEGQCNSCGWHACLWEHYVEDWEIAAALDNGGEINLSCVSKDDDENYTHRGVSINIKSENENT